MERLTKELPESLQRNTDILNESERMLREIPQSPLLQSSKLQKRLSFHAEECINSFRSVRELLLSSIKQEKEEFHFISKVTISNFFSLFFIRDPNCEIYVGDFGSHFREEKESDENLRKQVIFEIFSPINMYFCFGVSLSINTS